MLITVGGHSRNIGKTSVAAALIREIKVPWIAIKITQYGHGICSVNGKSCHCSSDVHSYIILEENDTSGKSDTSRFLAAGAKKSYWVRTKQGMLKEAIPALQELIKDQSYVMMESNSILQFLKPDLYLVVLDFRIQDFKESTRKYIERADALVLVEPDGQVPKWPGVEPEKWQNKPAFPVARRTFISEPLTRFVRSRMS